MKWVKKITAVTMVMVIPFINQGTLPQVSAEDKNLAIQYEENTKTGENKEEEWNKKSEENVSGNETQESHAVIIERVSPQGNSEVGEAVTIRAKATKPALYQFFVIRDGQEIPLSKYTERNEWQWIPYTPADYQIGVRVKNQDGEAESKEMVEHKVLESTLGINIGTVVPETEVRLSNPVYLQAEASGGIPPYRYQFYVVRDGKEIVFGGYSSRDSYNWMPYTAAQYQIGVRVKDAFGTEREAEKMPYSVIPSDLTAGEISISPEEWSYADEQSVVIGATAIKGKEPYQYQYYVIRNGKEIIIRDYSRERQCVWTPYTVAEYEVGARIKDATGSVVETERKQHSVRRHALEIKTFLSSSGESIVAYDATTLRLDCAGGAGKKLYRFYAVRDGQEIILQDYSSSNKYIWRPYTPAYYQVVGEVKDESGKSITEELEINVVKRELTFSTFQVRHSGETYTGQAVYIRVTGQNGIGEYKYRFYVIRDGREIPLQKYGKENIYVWTPITPSEYMLGVEVLDSKGNVGKKEIKYNVKQSNLKVSSFSMSRTGSMYQREKVRLTAYGSGGAGEYQYRFYVIRNGEVIFLTNYSAENTYVWQPQTVADYYVCVDVKDRNGVIASVMNRMKVKKFMVSTLIKGIPVVYQYPEYPNGCEPVSLNMVLNYWGIHVSKWNTCYTYMRRGPLHSTDPYWAYLGDPASSSGGYGCWAPVIKDAGNACLFAYGSKRRAVDISGASPETLFHYVSDGYPVIIWGTLNMGVSSWFVAGNINGRNTYWPTREHCMVLVGYDLNKKIIIVNDPIRGRVEYSMGAFETAYFLMGRNAVIVQ